MRRPALHLVLFLLLVVATVLPALVARAQPGPVTLSVQGGLNGRTRETHWTSVQVTATNHGSQDLNGFLLARVPGSIPGQVTRSEYRLPVILPAGTRKTVTLPVYMTLAFGHQVEFEHHGQSLARSPVNVNILSKEIVLAAALSDEPGSFQSLATVRIPGRQRVEVVQLTAESLPDDPILLEPLDVIAFSRFDTGRLSPKQRQAIDTWVTRGGTLIVATGPEWRATLAGLPESLVPVAITDTTRRPAGELAEFGGAVLAGDLPVAVGKLLRGSAIVMDGEIPLITVDPVGRGHVVFLAFDTALEPVYRWQGMVPVWEQLLTPLSLVTASTSTRFLGPPLPTSGIIGALERLPQMGLPKPQLLGGLLLGYLVLIGPASYLLLLRFDRRELAWVLVPAFSLLTVGLLYLVSFRSDRAGLHHTITITEMMPDARGLTRTYVGAINPGKDSMELTLPPGHMGTGLLFSQSPQTADLVRTRVALDQRTTLQIQDPDKWTMKGFYSVGQVQLNGTLDFAVNGWEGGRLSLTVSNKLGMTVRDAVAVSALESQRLGDLMPGESRRLSIAIGHDGGSAPALQFGRFFSADPVEMRRRDVLVHLFSVMRDADSPLQVTVYGWTDDSASPLPVIRGLGRSLAATNLVYARYMPEMHLSGMDIPPGLLVGRLVNAQAAQQPAVAGQVLKAGPGTYFFEFILPPLNRKAVSAVHLHFGTAGEPLHSPNFTLHAFNWKLKQWVEMPVQEQQPLPAWKDLVPPNGVVSIKIEVADAADIPLPSLSVRGEAR
jgi:hypothetical protein